MLKANEANEAPMLSLSFLLQKRAQAPVMRRALLVSSLKDEVELFFSKRALLLRFQEYREKERCLVIAASHPTVASEARFHQKALLIFLQQKKLPPVTSLSVIVKRSFRR